MAESLRRYAQVFDGVAEAYDRHRTSYPGELVDAVLGRAGLGRGSHVVEVGCGTGKLTELLVARGLVVEAVDPGENMIAFARRRVGEDAAVVFHLGRFEDVELPPGSFDAVLSATAFHWVEPAVGWAKAASLLPPGGTLALLSHLELRSRLAQEFRDALTRRVPEVTADWPPLCDEADLRAGAEERRGDIAALWTWLGYHDVRDPAAADLFGDAEVTFVPVPREETAAELWAVFETTSLYHRLQPDVRSAFRADVERLAGAAGGTVRSLQLAAAAAARRR